MKYLYELIRKDIEQEGIAMTFLIICLAFTIICLGIFLLFVAGRTILGGIK